MEQLKGYKRRGEGSEASEYLLTVMAASEVVATKAAKCGWRSPQHDQPDDARSGGRLLHADEARHKEPVRRQKSSAVIGKDVKKKK